MIQRFGVLVPEEAQVGKEVTAAHSLAEQVERLYKAHLLLLVLAAQAQEVLLLPATFQVVAVEVVNLH